MWALEGMRDFDGASTALVFLVFALGFIVIWAALYWKGSEDDPKKGEKNSAE